MNRVDIFEVSRDNTSYNFISFKMYTQNGENITYIPFHVNIDDLINFVEQKRTLEDVINNVPNLQGLYKSFQGQIVIEIKINKLWGKHFFPQDISDLMFDKLKQLVQDIQKNQLKTTY